MCRGGIVDTQLGQLMLKMEEEKVKTSEEVYGCSEGGGMGEMEADWRPLKGEAENRTYFCYRPTFLDIYASYINYKKAKLY